MDIQSPITNKKISNEDDFDLSISNEHNEQELTSIGESGIIRLMNLPHPNFSITNKNKLSNKQFDPNYNRDNFSTYTSMKKFRKEENKINDEIYTEVIKHLFNLFSIVNYWLNWSKKKLRRKRYLSYIKINFIKV